MTPNFQPPNLQLLADLKATLNSIILKDNNSQQNHRQNQITSSINQSKQEEKLNFEIKSLKDQLARKTTRIDELQKRFDDHEYQTSHNYKRQFRHLSDTLVQKQAEIQYLNKQIQKQKGRISSLQHDLTQANSSKQSLQQNLLKTIELIKGQFKELLVINEEGELEKLMSNTSLKQVLDKLQVLLSICRQMERKKLFMEDKYQRIKKQYNEQIQRNVRLEVELEKAKEQLWQERRINENINDKRSFVDDIQFISTRSKDSKLSKGPSQIMNYNQSQRTNPQHQFLLYHQQMEQTINLLRQETQMLSKFEQKLIQMDKKIEQQADIWCEVMNVKQLNTALKLELNQLKENSNPNLQNQLLQFQHPKLYQFFTQKMNQIQSFQTRLEKIEADAHRVSSMIEKILYQGVPQKNIEPNQKETLEKQKVIRSKVKKELLQIMENQKQSIRKETQNYYNAEIHILKEQITNLNHQTLRLKEKNQNLYNLLQENENLKQKQLLIEEKPQKMEIYQPQLNNNPEEKLETQSIIQFQRSQSQKHQFQFLQEKTERLEQHLKECKNTIEIYKKEIRQILDTHKLKNTKVKTFRCNQCLLRINDDKQDGKKCEKCKIDIHYGECAKIHDINCKKNKPNNNNKPKHKKTETKPPPPVYSQRLDYF